MREAVVEPFAAREREHLRRPGRCRECFADAGRAAVLPDRRIRVPPVVEQFGRVRERPSGKRHLVPASLEQLDQRPQDNHVRGVGQVDPDARHQPGRSSE